MGSFNSYLRCRIKRLQSRIVPGYQLWCAVCAVTLLAGCAPSLYSVEMKYVPTRTFARLPGGGAPPIALTVALFQDVRKVADTIVIGRVMKSNGERALVLPKFVKPPQAVTAPIKELFRQAGYRVATESPAWDLKESSINKAWQTILVGGSIDDLEIVCQNSLTTTKYTAKVKLTLTFANTARGKIFHTLTTDSSTSLDHVLFSEEKMEQQINAALAGAIEKLFDGRDIMTIINEGAK